MHGPRSPIADFSLSSILHILSIPRIPICIFQVLCLLNFISVALSFYSFLFVCFPLRGLLIPIQAVVACLCREINSRRRHFCSSFFYNSPLQPPSSIRTVHIPPLVMTTFSANCKAGYPAMRAPTRNDDDTTASGSAGQLLRDGRYLRFCVTVTRVVHKLAQTGRF